jgi:hypothetical protein
MFTSSENALFEAIERASAPPSTVQNRCHVSELGPFDQNLLIPLNFARLRQLVIKLVSRLLTEMLEVRILPGEPTPLSCRELRTFSLPSRDEMSSARIAINLDQCGRKKIN